MKARHLVYEGIFFASLDFICFMLFNIMETPYEFVFKVGIIRIVFMLALVLTLRMLIFKYCDAKYIRFTIRNIAYLNLISFTVMYVFGLAIVSVIAAKEYAILGRIIALQTDASFFIGFVLPYFISVGLYMLLYWLHYKIFREFVKSSVKRA